MLGPSLNYGPAYRIHHSDGNSNGFHVSARLVLLDQLVAHQALDQSHLRLVELTPESRSTHQPRPKLRILILDLQSTPNYGLYMHPKL